MRFGESWRREGMNGKEMRRMNERPGPLEKNESWKWEDPEMESSRMSQSGRG